jgi:hypothetical protein
MHQLDATNIEAIGYDDAGRVLRIKFRDRTNAAGELRPGGTYAYTDVPDDVFVALFTNDRPDTYFAQHIRKVFQYRKLDAPAPTAHPTIEEAARSLHVELVSNPVYGGSVAIENNALVVQLLPGVDSVASIHPLSRNGWLGWPVIAISEER